MQQSIWSGFLVAAELGEPVTYRCAGGRQLGDAQGRWQTVLDRCQSAVD